MCGAMEAIIWLASRDPAAVLKATDRPNSGANPGTMVAYG